jgi:hypothetical protein
LACCWYVRGGRRERKRGEERGERREKGLVRRDS